MRYKVTWTEAHEIEVEAKNKTEAFKIAGELSGQKDTCIDQDNYNVIEIMTLTELKKRLIKENLNRGRFDKN